MAGLKTREINLFGKAVFQKRGSFGFVGFVKVMAVFFEAGWSVALQTLGIPTMRGAAGRDAAG